MPVLIQSFGGESYQLRQAQPRRLRAVTAWSDAASHGRPQREPQTTASQLLQTHTLQTHNSSAIRANPCPEVTDPFCRLPLPTLFYRPEAVNLGDLLRIWVRLGARVISQEVHTPVLLTTSRTHIFKGDTLATGHHKRVVLLGPLSVSPGELTSTDSGSAFRKKRQLFPGLVRRL